MNIQKVIELGKKANDTTDVLWLSPPIWVLIMLIVSLVIVVASVIEFKKKKEISDVKFFLMFFVGITLLCYLGTLKVNTTDKVTPWRNHIAKTYIESLPIEKKEIVAIKIDTQYKAKKTSNTYWATKYTRKSTMKKTPLLIAYNDNGVVTAKNVYEIHVELSDKEKPYIEFQRLNKNLGHQVDKGLYNVKVYIPKSYNNIKIQ